MTGSRLCSPWPRARPSTFERALRAAAELEPGVTLLAGHADEVLRDHGRATGLPVEPQARAIYRSGWRPPMPDGPTRDDLVELITPLTAAR